MNKQQELAEQIAEKHLGILWNELGAGAKQLILAAIVEAMDAPAKEVESIRPEKALSELWKQKQTEWIDKHIIPMYATLRAQSIKYFLKDGTVSGSFRQALEDIMNDVRKFCNPAPAKEAISVPAQKGVSWIGIRDKLPGIGSKVIGYRPYAHTHGDDTITILKYEGEHNIDLNGHSHGFERSHCVSHWMPLPEPPAAQPLLPSLEEKKEDLVVSDNNSSNTACDKNINENV
jgi:hypothetical protein